MSERRLHGVALAALLALLAWLPASAAAQVAPDARWRTIRTAHFSVHFTPELDSIGRRAAADAEVAYAQLARRLHPPRGPIDLVVADNVDYSNGFTTPFPTNRIIVYAHPPLDLPSLRFYDDWLSLVITHELTHVFHLDRTRGWWRVAQKVFGRAPVLFPNLYDPAWITEGLATYYESDVTGAGRVEGTYERMLVEANVEDGGLLPFDRWNLVSTRYPGGDIAYGYGSLFFDFLARTRGRDRVRDFVERSSGATIPFLLNRQARAAFGVSFSDGWREWRDSLRAHSLAPRPALAGWRDLSRGGHVAVFPRWSGDSAVLFAGSDWKSSPAAWRADTAGRVDRIGRRNDAEENVPLPDGSIVFSQLDLTDPYHVRSDLWVQRGGAQRRLTSGARLAQPDARADGAIVAVHFAPATTQLVRVSPDGRRVTPIVPASPDTQWAEPRWSPRGDMIAATRWTRGGFADVVVLDTLGRVLRAFEHDRAFDGSPAWTPDGAHVIFASDRTGITDLYIATVGDSAPPRRISRATTGVFYPDVSPDGRTLAAARYDAEGWHVGIAPLDTTGAEPTPLDAGFADDPLPPSGRSGAPERGYSPWGALLPHYWLPIAGQTTTGGYSVGAFTSGSDVVGRHAWFAQLLLDPRDGEHTFDATYRYAGLGQPVVSAGATQFWDRQGLVDTSGALVGDLLRRTQQYSVSFGVSRPRVRKSAFASIGGELELRRYTTDPAPLIGRLADYYASGPRYWSIIATSGWSNVQRPPLAISPEDGISLAATGRVRWLEGASGVQSRSLSATLNAYKSVDVGAWAHHVIAARVASGTASGADPGEFDVGGSSGTPTSIFPGFTLGAHHTFAVRGFPSGARSGSDVLTGSLEWRAPIGQPRRGLGFWPLFLDRTSVSVFGDAGTAWHATDGRGIADWLASVGAELDLDTGLQYDAPYRLRLGVAAPVVNNSVLSTSKVSVYFQLGYAF
ncbi:MAG TPA: hypothetical protein VFS44_06240 [Gemmatimonadaceae bacterium]|nr:hypothetical protein [Gemmatimonadaceae bacterium]